LIEGALGAGWSPGEPDGTTFQWDHLFHILTGEEVNLEDTTEINSDILCESHTRARNQLLIAIGSDYFSKADYTPILIEWEGDWSVVMSTSIREGEQWYAKPCYCTPLFEAG
jgi:hypothetical protein